MVLTVELPNALSEELEERARQVGMTVTEFVVQELQRLVPEHAPESGAESHPLLDLAGRVWRETSVGGEPDLPTDFARNHDHYIHGAAKQ